MVHPGDGSVECRLQELSLARVAKFDWENSSEMPIGGLCLAVSIRERDQLSSFTEVTEVVVVCSDIDTMKTTVHNKGVIEACLQPDSKECQELQRSCIRALGRENQSCLNRSELRSRLEKNMTRLEDAWPYVEEVGETVPVPVRETDTEHPIKLDVQFNKIWLTTPILCETWVS